MRTLEDVHDFCNNQWAERMALVTELHLSKESIKAISLNCHPSAAIVSLNVTTVFHPVTGGEVRLLQVREYAVVHRATEEVDL